MQTQTTKLYRAEQVRELDRIAIQERGIPGYELMSRAGRAAYKIFIEHWPKAKSMTVFCGSGNNAGDGYIVAKMALQADFDIQVVTVTPVEKLRGDAFSAFQAFQQAGGDTVRYRQGIDNKADIIVDALLGTGLDRPVTGLYAEVIDTINQLQKPVMALDIPSGLNADSGCLMGCAVRAQMTITFIGYKQGLFSGDAAEFCGKIFFSNLGVPEDIYQGMPAASFIVEPSRLKRRSRCAHKGDNGHVLVIGGNYGYSGAVRLAAEAAARVGAGLVSIASRIEHAAMLNLNRPEIMSHGVTNCRELEILMAKASVIAIGPGLGQSQWAENMFLTAIKVGKPLVVDADALNILAESPQQNENWILTPHPGEAARLLNCSTAEIRRDRFAAVTKIQSKYLGICVLKGAGSLISDGKTINVSTSGNPGMASGGMGDVLTGVIAALCAQGMANNLAACTGAYWHGQAADIAAKDGERGLLASDLMVHLRWLVNQQ